MIRTSIVRESLINVRHYPINVWYSLTIISHSPIEKIADFLEMVELLDI